jgi:hypothetical protein
VLGFGTPFGMGHDEWSDLLVRTFRTMKVAGLK